MARPRLDEAQNGPCGSKPRPETPLTACTRPVLWCTIRSSMALRPYQPRRTDRTPVSALRHMGMNGEFNFRGRNPVKIRCCQYLNNVVEQDHRRVKGRLRPMLGFKTFYNARRVIIGIELAQKIHKRQFAIPIPWQSNPAVTWRHVMAA